MDENGPLPDAPTPPTFPRPSPDDRPVSNGAVAIGLLMVVVTLVGLLVARNTNTSDSSTTGESSDEPGDIHIIEPKDAVSDGEVKIEEHGYSELPGDEDLFSWGAVVTNTSRDHAVFAAVEITATDSSGDSILGSADDYGSSLTTPLLMPGDSVGLGTNAYIEEDAAVDDVEFEVAEPQWWASESIGKTGRGAPPEPTELKVSDIDTGWRNEGKIEPYWTDEEVEKHRDSEGEMVVRFKVESGARAIVEEPTASALFRDSKGKILGATSSTDFDHWAEFPPGWSQHQLEVKDGEPEGLDESKVEVYAYPGYMY